MRLITLTVTMLLFFLFFFLFLDRAYSLMRQGILPGLNPVHDFHLAQSFYFCFWYIPHYNVSNGTLITSVCSSPMHQRANGKAESAVKIMKSLLRKTHKEGGDPYEAMLEQRNTPHQDTGLGPAEMMFNRRTRSFLPTYLVSRAYETNQGHTKNL